MVVLLQAACLSRRLVVVEVEVTVALRWTLADPLADTPGLRETVLGNTTISVLSLGLRN